MTAKGYLTNFYPMKVWIVHDLLAPKTPEQESGKSVRLCSSALTWYPFQIGLNILVTENQYE